MHGETATVHGNESSWMKVTVLTPRGRGAVATVAAVGDIAWWERGKPLFSAANGRSLSRQPLCAIVFGFWGESSREEVVLCRMDENRLEIHCHGGDAAVERILSDCAARGATIERAGFVADAAFDATGRLETECIEALTRTRTVRTAEIVLQQANGRLRAGLEAIREAIVRRSPSAQEQLSAMRKWTLFGARLTSPWRVAFVGRPNVGKSSLMNALLGYARSIISPIPGTTRDVVTANTAFDGWPVALSDTAGVRDSGDELEAAGMDRGRAAAGRADLVVLVVDRSQACTPDDQRLFASFPNVLRVLHKADLPQLWDGPILGAALAASSLTGEGIADLIEAIVKRLVPEVPAANVPIPVFERLAREIALADSELRAGNWSAAEQRIQNLLAD